MKHNIMYIPIILGLLSLFISIFSRLRYMKKSKKDFFGIAIVFNEIDKEIRSFYPKEAGRNTIINIAKKKNLYEFFEDKNYEQNLYDYCIRELKGACPIDFKNGKIEKWKAA